MFTVDERDLVRDRLLRLAADDGTVTAAAITGSHATGTSDPWSDIDLVFGVTTDIVTALDSWTAILYREFGALHHWDLPSGPSTYRVFLLPDWLEVDIGFTPRADFGPLGPSWQEVFSDASTKAPVTRAPAGIEPSRTGHTNHLGLAWHHIWHTRVCIARGKPWQAIWLIDNARDHILALACGRLGLTTWYAKGVDQLPTDIIAPFTATLARSLDDDELYRVLALLSDALHAEVARTDPALAARLRPMLTALTALTATGPAPLTMRA